MKLARIMGFHAVTARLQRRPDSVVELFVWEARRDERIGELHALAAKQGIEVLTVDAGRLTALAQSDQHQGVVALVEVLADGSVGADFETVLAASLEKSTPPLFLLLDQIQDPHNLGACIRSADAFGADAVIVPKHGSAPLSAVALKAASGATETTPICQVSNLVQCIEALQAAGVWVLGAEMETEATLFNTKLTGPLAWVLGNEGKGLRRLTRERCDALVAIPMVGAVESLNVSVATAVCLYATQAARARGQPYAHGRSS